MKQFLVVMSLMLTLSVVAIDAAPKHRHHQIADVTINVSDSADKGIDAYSDTSSIANDDTLANNVSARTVTLNSDDFDDYPFSLIGHMVSMGGGGVLVAIFCILMVLIVSLSPVILIFIILYYLLKRRNQKMKIYEKAMENGQSIPEDLVRENHQSPDFLWRRGIRNASVGIGMMIMFVIWDVDALVGIGALVSCFGIGQIIISRTTSNKKEKKDDITEE